MKVYAYLVCVLSLLILFFCGCLPDVPIIPGI